MRVDGERHAPAAFTPGKDPIPIVQEVGWVPGPVWIVRKISPPPGFDTKTFQHLVSRYTDWAIPVHLSSSTNYINVVHVLGTTKKRTRNPERFSVFLVSANTILYIAGFLVHALYILNSLHYKSCFCCLREGIKAVFTDLTAIPL